MTVRYFGFGNGKGTTGATGLRAFAFIPTLSFWVFRVAYQSPKPSQIGVEIQFLPKFQLPPYQVAQFV